MHAPAKAHKLKHKALRQFHTGQWDKALANARELLLRLLKREPGNVAALLNLASVEREAGRLEEAPMYLFEARKLSPDNPAVAFNLGNSYVAEALYKKARDAFSAVVKIKPVLLASLVESGLYSQEPGGNRSNGPMLSSGSVGATGQQQRLSGLANMKRILFCGITGGCQSLKFH